MTRGERIGGILLGVALFAGLFYLIYDSFITGTAPYGEDATFAENLEDVGDLGLDEETAIDAKEGAEEAEKPATEAPATE